MSWSSHMSTHLPFLVSVALAYSPMSCLGFHWREIRESLLSRFTSRQFSSLSLEGKGGLLIFGIVRRDNIDSVFVELFSDGVSVIRTVSTPCIGSCLTGSSCLVLEEDLGWGAFLLE